jgi:hypothetical protein
MEDTACCTTHGRHHKKTTKLMPSFCPKSANISSAIAAAQLICPFALTCDALSFISPTDSSTFVLAVVFVKQSLTEKACHQEAKAPAE